MTSVWIARLLLGTALAFTAMDAATADDKVVKICVLTDLSGLYADLGGQGSIEAAKMAVEDSGMGGRPLAESACPLVKK